MDRVGQALGWSAPVGADCLTRRRGPACASASCRGAFQGLTASAAEPQDKLEPQASRSSSSNSRRTGKNVGPSRGRPNAHTGCQETCRSTLRVRKRRQMIPKKLKKRYQRASKRMPAERFFEKTKRRALSIFGFGSGSEFGAMLDPKNQAKRGRNRKKN